MMTLSRLLRIAGPSLFVAMWFPSAVMGQTETATVSGLVTDRTGAAVPGVQIGLESVERGTVTTTSTNNVGIYIFPSVHPGQYQISVQKQGFKQVDLLGLIVNVQDHIEQNFRLEVGSVAESVTVEGGTQLINTQDAAVSTVVDRQFAENLPMNGRSFQTLIQLTPGVVVTASNGVDNGQFSVNGQRAASNYWMVDGVSANVGIGTSLAPVGNGLSGANAGFSVLGGTNSLVSVDAMQEFRIQTSTFAPEFGRTPGGQISIVTRSGTNQWHGSAFDYFRNDVLDANDWFANRDNLPKPEERQNDFGGTVGGPVLKDKTFFLFAYEGLRLRLPQVVESLVPDVYARQHAVVAMQPYLNAFPLPSPNTLDDLTNEIGQFNASFSNSSTLDAYSMRIDHKLSNKLNLFGRYNFSPSKLIQRGGDSLNSITPSETTLQTATAGATWAISPTIANDLRFNYSRTHSKSFTYMDGFGGAVPLASLPFPNGIDARNGQFLLLWFSLFPSGGFSTGPQGNNLQRQINLVENLTTQKGAHNLKFGVDFRRLSPVYGNTAYLQEVIFNDVPSSLSGNFLFGDVASARNASFLFHNLGAFAQDTWRISPRLTITYGLRWDLDFAPSSNPAFLAVTGFNLNDLSQLALAPAGTPPFQTTYGNVAPRIGVAYQVRQSQSGQTVFRGGFGTFFDLATSEVGNAVVSTLYPFGTGSFLVGGTFPLSPTMAAPPPITSADLQVDGAGGIFDPHLKLPYTLQWNFAVEQALGVRQTLSMSYLGAAGRRLIQTAVVLNPSPTFSPTAQLVANASTSDYHALQVQFQRRLSRGLQALASYTWSHSIDTGSAGSAYGDAQNLLVPTAVRQNRGPSDFDIRNSFSAGVTYDIPVPKVNAFSNAILRGWSIENVVQARSATPVTVTSGRRPFRNFFQVAPRADVVAGQPLYLYGPQYPGGKALNPLAFVNAPSGRQGNLGRNSLRGFGAAQWDFSVHRDFPIRESIKLQFRAEMFNVLNHPNFGPPMSALNNKAQFGLSTMMLGQSLNSSNLGGGALSPLYQIGGPRSMQFALKLAF